MKANTTVFLPTWLKLCLFLITWFCFLIVFELIHILLIPEATEFSPKLHTLSTRVIGHLFQLAGTIFSVWIFTKYVDKIPFTSLGFDVKNRWKDILFGIFLGFIVMAFGYLLLENLQAITFNAYNIKAKDILYSIVFFISVSLMEEILCRGYILNQLLETNNKYVALVISSIIFTALHSLNPNMAFVPVLNLFLAGILLGITYIYTKNLWFPIALHFSWNFFQGPIFGFEVSGQTFYSMIQQTRTEDNLLNGGSFGFEGSLLATLIMIVVIFLIDRYYRKQIA
ncbi:CPBP family intramembrane glutamic endopeptidase [Kordia sp.]|uniref:CPBP family intramembrane glutamic endopeptidase n=1 Tax=Kordia sp. TaxID=1965332 RepID=UPI003B5A5DC3